MSLSSLARLVLLSVILALLLAGAAAGADTPSAEAAPAYHLQVGDVLGVVVLGEPAYSGNFSVRADGSVLFADDMVGAVSVAGLTAPQAMEAVRAGVGQYVKDPSISLTVTRFKVMVVGEVRQPGQYELESGLRLADAIARAGGPADPARGLRQVYVTSVGGDEFAYDLRAFREQGDAAQNPVVSPGDRISVGRERESSLGQYRVSGAVAKPGFYPLDGDQPTRLSDAVEACGRWTAEANPRAAQLLRKDGSKFAVDLTALDGDPSAPENRELQDGDEFFVPRNPVEVSLLGGVRKEGQYHVPTGTTLLEAIAIAGGLSDTALLKECAVMRAEPEQKRLPINLEKLMREGDMSQNPVLLDRDVVIIASQKASPGGKSALDKVTDSLSRYWWLFRIW